MTRILSLILFSTLSLCASVFGDVHSVSLGSLLSSLENENLEALLSREILEQASSDVLISRSPLLPKVDLNVSQSRSRSGLRSASSISNSSSALVQGSISLFDLTNWSDYKKAKMGYGIAKSSYAIILQSIERRAVEAFLEHIRNVRKMEVIEANITRDERLLELAQLKFKAGTAHIIDVTRAKSRVSIDMQERLQQESLVHASDLTIKKILNYDIQSELELDHDFFDLAVSMDAVRHVSQEELLSLRAEFKQASDEVESSKISLERARASHLPTVSLNADAGYASHELNDHRQSKVWSVGVEMSLPLFEGLRVTHERIKARSSIRQGKHALQDIENQIKSEYDLAEFNLNSRFNQIPLVKQQVILAQQELDFAETRFKNGVADNQEIVSAQASLVSALDTEVDAVYSFYLAMMELSFAQGKVSDMINYF